MARDNGVILGKHIQVTRDHLITSERARRLVCDVSSCTARANIIHNGVKLCREHHDNPEWKV